MVSKIILPNIVTKSDQSLEQIFFLAHFLFVEKLSASQNKCLIGAYFRAKWWLLSIELTDATYTQIIKYSTTKFFNLMHVQLEFFDKIYKKRVIGTLKTWTNV